MENFALTRAQVYVICFSFLCVTLLTKKGNLEPLRYGLPVRIVLHAAN